MKNRKTKTVNRRALNLLSMTANKRLPRIVNDNGVIKEYVGIGWIEISGDKADAYDITKLPRVIEDE